jgi:isopenicillin N synthase-like dioxygenase
MGSSAQDFSIPVIDINSDSQDISDDLLEAAANYGFVFVEDKYDAVPIAEIARLFGLSRTFFAAPVEVKDEVSISSNKAGKNHGWLSRGIEKLDPATQKRADVKE